MPSSANERASRISTAQTKFSACIWQIHYTNARVRIDFFSKSDIMFLKYLRFL